MPTTPAPKLPLTSVRVQNFKAIRDSGTVGFGWFNLLVGNNGTGKSSLVEALLALDKLTSTLPHMLQWARGYGSLHHQARHAGAAGTSVQWQLHGHDDFDGQVPVAPVALTTAVGHPDGRRDVVAILAEQIEAANGDRWARDAHGNHTRNTQPVPLQFDPGLSLASMLGPYWRGWQFLNLDPKEMASARTAEMAGEHTRLLADGANIAEYLHQLRAESEVAFRGVVAALRAVLPYADDLSVRVRTESDRAMWLEVHDGDRRIPSWMLSQGTLRVVALLACLRHPRPPRLLVVDEIENGLDPRTLGIVVEEMRKATTRGRTQIIATTHSVALLDHVPMDYVILCEREGDAATFRRPIDNADARQWAEKFPTGALYERGQLQGNAQ